GRADGSNKRCCRAVEVSRRTAAGKFERPAPASASLPDPENQPFPIVASGARGALLAWTEGSTTLVTRDWPAGQALGAPAKTELPGAGGVEALAIAGDGTARALIGARSPGNHETLGFDLYAA